MHEGGRNCLKYLKRGWNRKEGRRNKDFKTGEPAESRGGWLKMGAGAETPLQTLLMKSLLCFRREGHLLRIWRKRTKFLYQNTWDWKSTFWKSELFSQEIASDRLCLMLVLRYFSPSKLLVVPAAHLLEDSRIYEIYSDSS